MAIKNKQVRKLQHIKRKRNESAAKHKLRHERRKEETKNPSLREERLARSVPLTLDRKRTWDDIGSDDENLLGLSIDVERLKRQKQEEDEADKEALKDSQGEEKDSEDDEVDSMIMTDSDEDDEDEEDEEENSKTKQSRKKTVPTATERATSPTHSTRSTNLNLAPEALAAKFPALFLNETKTPKILITTAINSTLHHEAKLLTSLFPNSVYIRRTAHHHAHKFSIKEISKFASNRNFTALIVVNEDQKKVSGLDIVHLPQGPMFHFSVSNWIEGKKLPGHGTASEAYPELILNNFRSPLGILTAHLFKSLWPPQPDLAGRQVVTIHNQRDYCFVRRHRYVFREKRETEKPVVDTDGKEIKGVEGIKTGLQELGPRMTLKLRRVDKGIQRSSGQEWEWKGKMEKTRTKFQL
ncbi:RNA processing factor 1 [Talaromyces stipitatus ATCC 10500]|uniref:RNA processing factor 1 n=1 Tax=Talaromyces stipitatus (strain ATCC 10500 / CBS 375.48 / QM 6759 / NRRL 1006) TaxID=441959 RepID=B8MC22_TALSN|nr:RNA processing factor 1 [Talaromyces stipitatus ATCC 10500]EED18468.1 RNA processing factor 1 [Talaromyces stipitatus ATCC 10500]